MTNSSALGSVNKKISITINPLIILRTLAKTVSHTTCFVLFLTATEAVFIKIT